jgi:hypothetical protein
MSNPNQILMRNRRAELEALLEQEYENLYYRRYVTLEDDARFSCQAYGELITDLERKSALGEIK